jgi:Leucine-rich repeat (LRR) protein
MEVKESIDRLAFLAENFNVFKCTKSEVTEKCNTLLEQGYQNQVITDSKKKVLAILSTKMVPNKPPVQKISICFDVYSAIIAADPTENKIYLQWMLNLFTKLIKHESIMGGRMRGNESEYGSGYDEAIRFVKEDLPIAKDYLTLFNNNNRKNKFKELSASNFHLKNITDPTNINQYKSLSQLFEAVDPFIEKQPSEIEAMLNTYVKAKQAEIPFKDRKYTVYIPKTRDSSVIFNKYVSWCTAAPSNGNFKSYTENNKKPNGKNSDLYIIIGNDFFNGTSKELYQLHFETSQLKNNKNSDDMTAIKAILNDSEGISNYFYDELMTMAKQHKDGLDNNKYLNYLMEFGFTQSMFEIMREETPIVRFMDREIKTIPDIISKFVNLNELVICDAKLTEIHPNIGKLQKLELLSLTNNNLTTLPTEIGNLKRLEFLNLTGNPIIEIPDSIQYLDPTKGGSLFKIAITKEDKDKPYVKKLRELLPSVKIG